MDEFDYIPTSCNVRNKRGEILADGSERKYLRGDIRKSDGLIFGSYAKQSRKKTNDFVMREIWYSKDVFDNQNKAARKRANEFRKNNPDEIKRRKRESDARCIDRVMRNSKQWTAKNRERSRAIKSKWRIANPDQTNKLAAKRRSRKRNALLMLHRDQEQIINAIYDCSRRVSECIKIPHEVDHIVPISRGGYHIHTNMQVIPMRLNRSKSDKLPHEFSIAA